MYNWCKLLIVILEKGDIKAKTEALKKVIFLILNGEKLPNLLMTIIRFLLPLQVNIVPADLRDVAIVEFFHQNYANVSFRLG